MAIYNNKYLQCYFVLLAVLLLKGQSKGRPQFYFVTPLKNIEYNILHKSRIKIFSYKTIGKFTICNINEYIFTNVF